MTSGEFVDEGAVETGVKTEVEVLQGARFAEAGRFVAPGDGALLAHVDFILEDQFQELGVREPVGFGFLQTQLQAVKQPRKSQIAGMLFEGVDHGGGLGLGRVGG